MLSSLLHNAAQTTSVFDRIQTHGTRIVADHYPEAFQRATSKLQLLEKGINGEHHNDVDDNHVDTICARTCEYSKEEWDMDEELFVLSQHDSTSNDGETEKIKPVHDDEKDEVYNDDSRFELEEQEKEEVRRLKENVFEEMKERIKIRKTWKKVGKQLQIEHKRRRRKRKSRNGKNHQRPNARKHFTRPHHKEEQNNTMLTSLQEFYEKFDLVVADLEDRQNLIEIEEFKQLVIQDLSDRSEALHEFKQRLPVVLQELMEKVVIHDLKHDGLLPNTPKRLKPLLCDEWIELADDEPIADESDWILCDD